MTGGSDLGTHGTTLSLCAVPRLKEMAVESPHSRDLWGRPPELMQAIPGIQGAKTLLRRSASVRRALLAPLCVQVSTQSTSRRLQTCSAQSFAMAANRGPVPGSTHESDEDVVSGSVPPACT